MNLILLFYLILNLWQTQIRMALLLSREANRARSEIFIHDCSMPPGRGVNFYVSELEKFHFQTIDDAFKLIDKGYYLAKVDLRHAYRSVLINLKNYRAMGLKWKFMNHWRVTFFIDTRLPFGGREVQVFSIASHKV